VDLEYFSKYSKNNTSALTERIRVAKGVGDKFEYHEDR
jgi:hypothetical protein